MARRKKARKTTRRRRSIGALGAMGGGVLLKVAGAVAGKVLSNVLDKQLGASMTGRSYLVAGAPAVAGFVLPMVSKNATVKALAEGMLIIGAVQLVKETGAIGNIMEDDSSYNRNFVALGPSNQNPRGVVAGISGLSLEKAALLS